jgi:hypothetical protein
MKRVKRASPTLYHAWEKEKEGKSGRLPITESKGETAKPLTDDSRPPKTWKRKSPEDLRKSKTNSKIQSSQPLRKRHGESIQNCCHVCKEREDCFQYVCYDKTYMLGLSCRLGKHVSVSGDGKIVYNLGWIVDRIRKWTEKDACMA